MRSSDQVAFAMYCEHNKFKTQIYTSMSTSKNSGLTLIELMIAVAVIGILVSIAVPSYQEYVRQGRRAAASAGILDIAQDLERWRVNSPTYANCPTGTGNNQCGTPAVDNVSFAITAAATTYSVTATISNDSTCGTMSIDQSGSKSPTDCWKK
jgi:type IV pilus assembly protein PilE